jgi:WD40 repeat protein
MAPDGSFVVIGNAMGLVRVQPLDGGPARELTGLTGDINWIKVGPESRLVAIRSAGFENQESIVRVWDLTTDEVRMLDAGDGREVRRFEFATDGDLWVFGRPMVRRWRLADDGPHIVEEFDLSGPEWAGDGIHGLDEEGRRLLVCKNDEELWFQHLDTHEAEALTTHPHMQASLHANIKIITSLDGQGGLFAGPATGEEPHLLMGHGGRFVFVSPDGRWIASAGTDLSTIVLWPMPDFSKPPLHTLPREELIAKLKTLTNLRVVRDEQSKSGWTLDVGPFPGWETVPTW